MQFPLNPQCIKRNFLFVSVAFNLSLPLAHAAPLQGRLIYQDDFSSSNALWRCGLFNTQGNQTAISASYVKIEGGLLQMKANVGCGWDYVNSRVMLNAALPAEYAIEFRVNKPTWCGHFNLWVSPTNDFQEQSASTNSYIWYISGDWFGPIYTEGANQTTINPLSTPFSNGSWYQMRLEKRKSGMFVYVNGALKYSYTGPLFEGGFLRLMANSSGSVVQLDDLKIFDLGIPLLIETAAVRLRWLTESNVTYQVQWTTNNTNWTDFMSIVGTGSETNIVEWVEKPRRFYRVLVR